MTTATRNLLINGAALSTAAAIMVAAPAVVTGQVAGLPTPNQLSVAQYELTALTDLSVQGLTDALTNGYGGYIGAGDAFYPGVFNNDTKVSGFLGAAYYLVDNTVGAFVPFHLDNYFFEVGGQSGNVLNGLGAVAYVGVGSIFGANSVPAQLVKTLVGGGSVDLGSAIMQLTAGIPVIGNLASVYFTGQAIGDTTDYGTGFGGLLNYANTLLPGLAQLGGLTGVISAVTGFIGGIFGGRGWGHDDEDEGDHHGGSYSDSEDEDEDDDHHHHNWSAASVVNAARTAVSAPKAAATASVAAPAAAENTKPAEVEAPEVTSGTDTVVEVTTPKVDTTDVAGSDNAGDATVTAPKQAASRGGASKGAEKSAQAHEGKRAKVSRAS